MNQTLAFGVGCFHFGYNKHPPFEYSTKAYVEDVKNALNALPSLSEITVSYEEVFANAYTVSDNVIALDDGGLFPHVMFLNIEFEVFIPYRVQGELFPGEEGRMRTSTERFRVRINDSFHGPVAFVECIAAAEDCSPSDSIRLLKKFLKREFAKLRSCVTFESLGPSPFHANFYLRPALGEAEEIEFEEIPRRGYNDFVFRYGSTYTKDEALLLICNELAHELGLFYEIQRRCVRLMQNGQELLDGWQRLQGLMDSRVPFWHLKSRMKIHRAAQELVSSAYTLEAQFAVERNVSVRDVASTYNKGTPTYLHKFIQAKVEDFPAYPIDSILKWAEHVEGASFKRAEIAAVVLSALSGGVVGSLATLLSSGRP